MSKYFCSLKDTMSEKANYRLKEILENYVSEKYWTDKKRAQFLLLVKRF